MVAPHFDGPRPAGDSAAYKRAWDKANRDRVNEGRRRRHAENPARRRETDRAWLARVGPRPSNRKPRTPEQVRASALRRKYGLTVEQLAAMVSAQGGRCAVCGVAPSGMKKSERLFVDHCHKTGRVRSLLCSNCNTAAGMLRDDPFLADALAAYLRKHSDT